MTSTLRATAAPYVPPATRTGATTQRKDEFVTLSTHLAAPPMTTHPGTPSPSPLDSATTAACVPHLAGPEALGEGLPVPGWERGGGPARSAAGKSGESTRAPADQGGDDHKAAQVSPSLLQHQTKPVCASGVGNCCPNGDSTRTSRNCITAVTPDEPEPRDGRQRRRPERESGKSAPALADQGDKDDKASQVSPSLLQPQTQTIVCVREAGNCCPNGRPAQTGDNCITAAAPEERGPQDGRQRRRLGLLAALPPVAEPPSPVVSPPSTKAPPALRPAPMRSAPPAPKNCCSKPRRGARSVRWADMGGRPLVTSSRTFAPSRDKRALFHTAAQIQRWKKEDKARWKKERRKGRAPRTYQKWVFGQEALSPSKARARHPALQRLPSASCAPTPTEGPASPPPVTPPVAAPKRGPVPTTKPPSSKPGLVESEPPREVVPAPPARGAAPTSTLRASAVPFAPPEAITGAAVQSKDRFMSLYTHLAPPPSGDSPRHHLSLSFGQRN